MFGGNSTQFSFGQQPQQQSTGFGFGSSQQPQQPSMFGAAPAAAPFGVPAATTGFGALQQQQPKPMFGQPATTAFGAATSTGTTSNPSQPTTTTVNNGTGNPAWAITVEREQAAISVLSNYQAISAMPAYKNWSIEELRAQDYMMNKKFASQQQAATGFGATTSAFGQPAAPAFGSTMAQPSGGMFGGAQNNSMVGGTATNPTSGFGFGSAAPAATTAFGATTNAFGAAKPPAFGAAPAATGFGGGAFGATANPAPAFGQTNPSTGGGFGTQPSAFGQPAATPAGGGLFGNNQQKPSLFGSTAQPAATGFNQQPQAAGFGASAFGQPAQGTSASTGFGFGNNQPKPAVSAFGGQPAQSTLGGGGLFGAKPAAAPGVAPPMWGAGAIQQQQPQQSSFGFGTQQQQQQQQPQQTGGLFGQSNTQQPQTGLFNTNNTNPASNTGGLFGANSAFKPAGTAPGTSLFGAGAAAGTTQPSSFFGAAQNPQGQQQQSTGLFGQGSQAQPSNAGGGLFSSMNTGGAVNTAPGLGGGTGGLFGANSAFKPAGASLAPTGGLGGATGGGSLFGSSFGAGGLGGQQPSLLGGGLQSMQQQQPQQQGPVLHASLNMNPYGINPLLQKSPNQPGSNGSDKKPVNSTPLASAAEKKLPTLTPSFKVTPRSSSQIKLRGIAPAATGPSLAESHRNQISSSAASSATSSSMQKKSLHLLDGSPRDVVALGLDSRFTPRRSVKRLDIDDASIFLSGGGPGSASATPHKNNDALSTAKTGQTGGVFVDPTLEDAAAALIANSGGGGSVSSTPASKNYYSNTSSRNVSPSPPRQSASPGSAVTNTATSYIMSPSIDQLLRLSDLELSSLENFSISVPLYGSVSFIKPVDLLAASPSGNRAGIQDIPGKIVVISSQLVTVYPDDSVKHERGQGLNVPAIITLASCFPKDRKTGDIIDNESDPRFDKHLKKLRNMPDTTFLGFEVISGTWKFRVEHFSKYGLLDDDESDDDDDGRVKPASKSAHTVPVASSTVSRQKGVQFQDDQLAVDEDDEEEDVIDDTFLVQSDKMKWNAPKTPLKVFSQSPLSRQVFVQEDEDDDEEEEEEEEMEDEESGFMDEDMSNEESAAESETAEDEELSSSSSISDKSADQDANEQEIPPMNSIHASMATVERIQLARNVQTMKASLFPASAVVDATATVAKSSPSRNNFGKKIVLPHKPVSFSFKQYDEDSAVGKDSSLLATGKRSGVDDEATVPTAVSRTEFSSLPVMTIGSPQKYSRQDRLQVSKVDLARAVPYEDSITFGKHKSGALDAAFYMGRSFRAGFGPFGTYTCLKSMTHVSIKNIGGSNESSSQSNHSILHHTATLECVLENTDIFTTTLANDGSNEEIQVDPEATTPSAFSALTAAQESCPKSVLKANFDFSKLVQVSSQQGFSDAEIDTWKLCSALWDRLELDIADLSGFNDEQLQAIEIGFRKARFSEWLQDSCTASVDQDLVKASNDVERIFLSLSGNRLANAVKLCLSSKNFHLATILTQLPTPLSVVTATRRLTPNGCPGRNHLSESVQRDLVAQIGEWSKSTFKESPQKLAIWTLVSGGAHLWDEDVLRPSFDWKRVFGLFFWYSQGGSLSIKEAVEHYTANLDVITKPESAFSKDVFDLKYHLLQVFASEQWPLEDVLNPSTHTASGLDYRVSWLLGMLLTKVFSISQFKDSAAFAVELGDAATGGEGLMELDEPSVTITSKTQDVQLDHFISQLESLGLWKWAIFAATFHSNHINRECRIRALLRQWYPLQDASGSSFNLSDSNLSDDYVFLTRKLYIPAVWIHEARALKARYENNVYLEITCLLDAKKFSVAQDLILSLYVPTILIGDSATSSTATLLSLLSKFPESEKSRLNWTCKGGLVYTFVELLGRFSKDDDKSIIASLQTQERKSLELRVSSALDVLADAGGGSQKLVQLWTTGQGPRLCTPEIKSQVYICLCEITEFFSTLSLSLLPTKIDVARFSLTSSSPSQRAQFVRQSALLVL